MTGKLPPKEKLKVFYDSESGVLWLANGKPRYRSCDVSRDLITVFFESEEPIPSALKVSKAAELLCPFFGPPEARVSDSSSVVFCKDGDGVAERVIEDFLNPQSRKSDSLIVVQKDDQDAVEFQKFLMKDDLDIYYESEGDTLSLGNGRPAPYGGHDIAEGLIVFFESKGVPVLIEFFDAADQIGDILAQAKPSNAAGLI